MTLHHSTARRIIRVLRDASDAVENVGFHFFDEGSGPRADLMRVSYQCERLAAELKSRSHGTFTSKLTPKRNHPASNP